MYTTLEFYATDCGFQNGCAKCRQVYEEGPVVVLVVADHTHYFMLGVKPENQYVCCGEQKAKQVAIFPSREAALARAAEYERVFKEASTDLALDSIIPLLQMDDITAQIAIDIGLVRSAGTVQ